MHSWSETLVCVRWLASWYSLGAAGCGSSSDSSPTPTSPTPTATPTPTPTTTTASLSGTVLNSSGESISGATVTVLDGPDAGTSTTTNGSGAYSFAALTTGNVNFSVTATFYSNTTAGIAIDGTNTLNFTMTRKIVPLGGSVENDTGVRIVGATVTILDGANAEETAVTNSNGDYRFAELTSANVNFKATAAGYLDDRRGVEVNGTSSLNFTLALIPTFSLAAELVTGGTGTSQEWRFTVTTNQTFETYNWDFGDGNRSTGSGPIEQHVYTPFGTRTISVTGVRADFSTQVVTLDVLID